MSKNMYFLSQDGVYDISDGFYQVLAIDFIDSTVFMKALIDIVEKVFTIDKL